ncbi:hypothetical protein JIN85_06665 [Luteolibacter pohnpeiensis]|uniref:Uncharacterized protein n=1 Tax=Luteolibacter pohnpeiensis TaxID=454153 RepID=A0A934S6I3_9BACT|nr:hypothetical protein [Luteolibacter pohnpeiensis]MBK1882089.1 hypothetical protein [Luteolibacter pohnpeiensis]
MTTQAAPDRGARRIPRRWLRILFYLGIIVFVLIPLLAFGGSNLFLASAWGRGFLAGKIEKITRLEASIGGASWSPWNGISLSNVRLMQPPALRKAVPQPVAKIEKIRLEPVWSAWLRGHREIRALHLDSPKIVLPLQLISQLIPPTPEQKPAQPTATPEPSPEVAANPTPVAPVPEPDPLTGPTSLEVQPSPPKPQPPPIVAPPLPPTPPKPKKPVPTSWIHLHDASFSIVYAGINTPIFELNHLTSSLPVAGDAASSTLRIGSMNCAGRTVFSNLKAPLTWKAPFLDLKPVELETDGLKMSLEARLGMLAGLPAQFEYKFPAQSVPEILTTAGSQMKLEKASLHARLIGLLLAPASIQGDLVAELEKVSVKAGDLERDFDTGRLVTILRQGSISCVDARLIGDDLSFLGNATLRPDGRSAGILRMVAPPESIENLVRRMLPKLNEPPKLTELSTPQRVALDLEMYGRLEKSITLSLGHGGPSIGISTTGTP